MQMPSSSVRMRERFLMEYDWDSQVGGTVMGKWEG